MRKNAVGAGNQSGIRLDIKMPGQRFGRVGLANQHFTESLEPMLLDQQANRLGAV